MIAFWSEKAMTVNWLPFSYRYSKITSSLIFSTGSVTFISIVLSIPKALLILFGESMKAATDVTGVITMKSLWPDNLLSIKRRSIRLPVSKSKPPKLIRFPSIYRRSSNLPSLSVVVFFSSLSFSKLLFSSMKISAPLMYPSIAAPWKTL